MADAELGIVIKTTGADESAASLDKFTASAKGAATAANDLSTAQLKADSGSRNLFTGGRSAAGELANQAAKAKEAGQSFTATGQSLGFFRSIWQGMTQELSKGFDFHALGAGATVASGGINIAANATREFREAARTAAPLLYAMGGQITGLGHFALLARAGIVGLAAGLTGALVIGLERAGDAIDLVQKRLQTLGAGGGAFDILKKTAASANTSIQDLLPSFQAMINAENRASSFRGFDTLTGEVTRGLPGDIQKRADATDVLSKSLQLEGETATAASAQVNKLVEAMAEYDKQTDKATGLTQDMFINLQKTSPALAHALEQALGGNLWERLQKGPVDYKQVIQGLSGLRPKIDTQYLELKPNVTQSWDMLKTSVIALFGEIAKAGQISGVGDFLSNMTEGIKKMNIQVQNGGNFWDILFNKIATDGDRALGLFVTRQREAFATWRQNIYKEAAAAGDAIQNAFTKLFTANESNVKVNFDLDISKIAEQEQKILDGFDSVWKAGTKAAQGLSAEWSKPIINANSITSSVDLINNALGTLDTKGRVSVEGLANVWQQLDAAMWKVAQDAVAVGNQMIASWASTASKMSTLGKNFVVPGGGGTSGGPSFQVGGMGNVVPGSTGYTGYSSTGQGGASAAGYYPGVGAEGAYYATGGAFTVSGTGGTDSVPVRFMATPGETVTITPPDLTKPNIINATTADIPTAQFGTSAAATQPAAIPVSAITTPITFAVKDSTGKIVGAVDSATQAIAALTTATNSAASATTAAVNNISTSVTRYAPTASGFTVNTSLYSGKSGTAAGPLGAGPVDAYGNVVPSTVATYVARINRNASIAGSAPSQGVPVYAVNPNYQPMASGGTFIVPGAGGTDTVPVRFMATPGERVTVTTPEQSRVTVLSPTTTPATPDVSMTGTAIGAANKTVLGTTITSPITSTVKDTSSKIVSAVKDISTSVNNMATDVGNAVRASASTRTIFSGSSSTTSNSGPTIIAPPVPRVAGFVAGMASGGTFTVPGSGATDSVPIRFMATPGEHVSVTPTGTGANPSAAFGLQTALSHMDKAAQVAKTNLQQLVSQMVDTQRQGYEAITQRYAKSRPIVVNIVGAANPTAFINSESQIRRTVRRALG